jgi:7-cyano-7-deazaguanine tRNA-ribosyltransferase
MARDLLGRIGRIKTKSGIIETPILLPVINPSVQIITPSEMRKNFGCTAIITNAYLLKKNFEEEVKALGIHSFLNFKKVVVTDSGAYQLLKYREIETTPSEIAKFEEEIDTDVAVILDVPTGWNSQREIAEYTVKETIKRARHTLASLTRDDILWVGPIQGGNYLDLVSYSALEIGKMPFQIFALGSPTQVMERYLFSTLMDMIAAAKKNLPIEKPFHLFGGGHPFMFCFAVAAGCDIFDSAAYAIYAKKGRYMTNYGTLKLKNLKYFPCACKTCSNYTPQDLKNATPRVRTRLLAYHNLATCFIEIKRIKQAIKEGRLRELLDLRSRSHPSLLQAYKNLKMDYSCFEEHTPISKERGILYFDSTGLNRPEIVRHRIKLQNWIPPEKYRVLVLLPNTLSRPFSRSKTFERILKSISRSLGYVVNKIHFCVYAVPFGIIPYELDEIYPLSQYEAALPSDKATNKYVAKQVENYIENVCYETVILCYYRTDLGRRVRNACKNASLKADASFFSFLCGENAWTERSVEDLIKMISDAVDRLS